MQRNITVWTYQEVCEALFLRKTNVRRMPKSLSKTSMTDSDSLFQSQTKLNGNKSNLTSERHRKYKSNDLRCHVC